MDKHNKTTESEEVPKSLMDIFHQSMVDSSNVEEILERQVMKLGNSGRVSIPAKHIGKKARVTIFKNKEEDAKKS